MLQIAVTLESIYDLFDDLSKCGKVASATVSNTRSLFKDCTSVSNIALIFQKWQRIYGTQVFHAQIIRVRLELGFLSFFWVKIFAIKFFSID